MGLSVLQASVLSVTIVLHEHYSINEDTEIQKQSLVPFQHTLLLDAASPRDEEQPGSRG